MCINPGCIDYSMPVEQVSPSGLFVLSSTLNRSKEDLTTYLCIIISIEDIEGKNLATIQTHASARMNWSVNWDSNDSIILESSDIGTYKWHKTDTNQWVMEGEYGFDPIMPALE